MHPFDRWLCRRSLAFTAVALAMAIGIVLATDEAFSTARMRVARLCALAPALAALGAGLALSQAQARGELRALEALGGSPLRVARGAVVAGWMAGIVAVLLLASPFADPSSLFPTIGTRGFWTEESGSLADASKGLRVWPHGEIEYFGETSIARVGVAPSRIGAALAVGLLGLIVPIWVTARTGVLSRAAMAMLSVGLMIVLLHAVAAGRVGPPWLLVSALPIALEAAIAHRKAWTLP